jgi:hypothetical protein
MDQITNQPANVDELTRALTEAREAADVVVIQNKLDLLEEMLRKAGYAQSIEKMLPVREGRMKARHVLGPLLAPVDRNQGARTDLTSGGKHPKFSFSRYIKDILNITINAAKEAQRIGALPNAKFEKALAEAREQAELISIDDLVTVARPYWYIARRKQRHQVIAAKVKHSDKQRGPFPLLYCDPPWQFATYSEKGTEKTPDQHYPTMSYDELAKMKVWGKTIKELAHKDAAIFMWCTSSNLHHAIDLLQDVGGLRSNLALCG